MDNTWIFILTFLPLVLYVVVDAYSGLRLGVISAVCLGICATLGIFWLLGGIEWEAVMVLVLMAVTGFFSVKKNDPLLFKVQPLITGVFSSLFLAYFQFLDTPLFIKYLPKMEHMLDTQVRALINDPIFVETLTRINLHVMIWVFVHALVMGLAAYKWSNKMWLVAKALGLPFVVIASLISVKIQTMFLA